MFAPFVQCLYIDDCFEFLVDVRQYTSPIALITIRGYLIPYVEMTLSIMLIIADNNNFVAPTIHSHIGYSS